ncbi:MAG: SGNH/GDSL hydrolase family protein [Lachnospiraceae bacterium]|nr:SGNH/GDSL hydrolase family protein [Lachnospiraceae bacterium]
MILNLGYVGENEHRTFNFDCKKMFGEYPSASVSLTVQPPAGDCYPATVERDGDLVSWTVTDSDLIEEGYGEVQLTFMVGDVKAKTCIGRTKVERSLGATGDIPTPIENWIEQAEEVISEAEAATAAAEGAAEHQPIIDDNGYWAVWDADAEEYVATEYKAQGTDGHDGVGIVSIEKTGTSGLVDTYTITFTSGNPVTYTVTNGRDADPAELIDDTAGAGDTDKVWSADKSAAENSSLLTEINSKQDAPETAGTAGQVLGLDANLKPEWKTVSGGGVVDASLSPTSENPVQNKAIVSAIDAQYEMAETTATAEAGSYTWCSCSLKKGVKYIIRIYASKTFNSNIDFSTAGANQVYVTNPLGTLNANTTFVEVTHTPSVDISYIRFKMTRSDSCVYTIKTYHLQSADVKAQADDIEANALIPGSAEQITSTNYTSFFTDANLAPAGKSYFINANVTSAMIANLPAYNYSAVLVTIKSQKDIGHGIIQIYSNSTGCIWFRFESGYSTTYNYTGWTAINAQNKMTCKIFKKVVCCGDSYCSGYIKLSGGTAVDTNEDYAWPHYMATATGNEYVNCGVSGANVWTWQSAQRGLLKAQSCGKAQAYIVSFAINDASSGAAHIDVGTSADIGTENNTYYAGLSKIIRELNTINPTAKIFVTTIPTINATYSSYIQAVRDIVEAYKNTYPVYCLDLRANIGLYQMPSITGDIVNGHYTAIAYEQFAEIFCYLISEYINTHVTDFQNVFEIPYEAGT